MRRIIINGCVDRVAYLKSLCAGKVVLHLGCAGAGLTLKKLKDGSLLHLCLASVVSQLYGVDLDADSVEIMRKNGIPNLFVGDCEHLDQIRFPETFDVILAANLLNLLGEPGKVLEEAKKLLKPDGNFVVSTDNIYSVKKFLTYLLLHIDMSHPSHLWHASPSSLGNLLERSGYVPSEIRGFWTGVDILSRQTLRDKWSNYILSRLPLPAGCADGLIVRARLATSVA